MENIGNILRETREETGVSIKEASSDLNINENFLLNIEEGKIGCFKDIYVLKDYIISYAKYLGIDDAKLIDEFNEYMFEYTSKIPIKEIEKKAKKEAKEETQKIASPYTRTRKYSRGQYIAIYLVIILLVILAIVWSVKQITVDSHVTSDISFVK